MQYFYNSRLGETRFTMSDGGLLCKDVPIGRTGVQLYGGEELDDIEPDSDGEILVERTEDEVFRPETLASFEGMTFTVSHPIEDVTPDNWGRYAAGHIQNVRRGTGDQSDLMIADIVVKKAEAIKVILEDGVDQISAGYDDRYSQTCSEADLNPNVANRNKGERKAPDKNLFSEAGIIKLESIFHENIFDYQRNWFEAGLTHRIRNILKSRQIGATFFFAREALLDAIKTGRNQIFLSASKAQAHVFKSYIIDFARMVDVDLNGEEVIRFKPYELISED